MPLRERTSFLHRVVPAVCLCALTLLAASCFVLKQDQTYAIGTESWRVNLVVYKSATKIADDYRKANGTAKTRSLILAATPSSFSLTSNQKAMICSVGFAAAGALGGAAACLASHYLPALVLNWFRSDVRARSDLPGDLSSAARQHDCFSWTMFPSRNFGTKPPGNSGCR